MIISENCFWKVGEDFSQVLLTLKLWIRFVRGATAEAWKSPIVSHNDTQYWKKSIPTGGDGGSSSLKSIYIYSAEDEPCPESKEEFSIFLGY